MSVLGFIVCLGLGGLVGFFAGLFGIGGGVLYVPFLYAFFAAGSWTGFEILAQHQAVMAHGTSLAIIIPTALSGAWVYARRGRVAWRVAIPMAASAAAVAPFGADVAVAVDPRILQVAFGLVVLVAGARLLTRARTSGVAGGGGDSPEPVDRSWSGPALTVLALGMGAVEGLVAGLLGIGGAVIAIPMLIYLARLDLREVAGTAVVVVVVAATAGAVSYLAAGSDVATLPAGAAGFIFLPVVVAMVPGAVGMAQVGARVNHRLHHRGLLLLFGCFLAVVGVRLIVTNWSAATWLVGL